MNAKTLTYSLFSLLLLSSCGEKVTTTHNGQASSAGLTPACTPATSLNLLDAVTYTGNVQALLTTNCTSCHSAAGKTAPDLSSFALATAGATASLAAINGGTMPPSGALAAADKATFAAWVSGGTLQTAGAATATTATPATTSPSSTAVATGAGTTSATATAAAPVCTTASTTSNAGTTGNAQGT